MYVDYDADKIRPILHTYFIVAFLVLSIIGQECCKLAIKASLRRGRQVPLHRMTGWVSGFSFLTSTLELQNIPGGLVLGLIMLLVTVLSPINTIIIGALVTNVQVSTRCEFGQGMISNTTGPYIFNGPPFNGQPKLVASNAQIISVSNGGLPGIYKKVNSDPTFQAQSQDVLANWVCTDVNDDLTYSPDTDPTSIVEELQNKGYLYSNFSAVSQGPSQGYEHFVVWSASANLAPWDVKASIDLNALPTDNMVMRSFHCVVDSNAADGILGVMDSYWCMSDWVQGFQGGCYDGSNTPAIDNAGTFIEQYLNSMIMVQAGNNNLLQSPSAGSDTTQGCLLTRANIPTAIFVLVGIAGLLVLGIFVAWLVLLVGHACSGLKGVRQDRSLLDYVPIKLTSWMLHAARESAIGNGIEGPTETKALKEWNYAVVGEGGGLMVARLVDRGSRRV